MKKNGTLGRTNRRDNYRIIIQLFPRGSRYFVIYRRIRLRPGSVLFDKHLSSTLIDTKMKSRNAVDTRPAHAQRNIKRVRSARKKKIVMRFCNAILTTCIEISKSVDKRPNVPPTTVVVENLLMNVKRGKGENTSRTEKSLG